jgi:hypothetical protein
MMVVLLYDTYIVYKMGLNVAVNSDDAEMARLSTGKQ